MLRWVTGYSQEQLDSQIDKKIDCRTFIEEAPLNPDRTLIKGVVCGVRVEEVEDPLMRELRYMDKVVDELARGKKMESILRKRNERRSRHQCCSGPVRCFVAGIVLRQSSENLGNEIYERTATDAQVQQAAREQLSDLQQQSFAEDTEYCGLLAENADGEIISRDGHRRRS